MVYICEGPNRTHAFFQVHKRFLEVEEMKSKSLRQEWRVPEYFKHLSFLDEKKKEMIWQT